MWRTVSLPHYLQAKKGEEASFRKGGKANSYYKIF